MGGPGSGRHATPNLIKSAPARAARATRSRQTWNLCPRRRLPEPDNPFKDAKSILTAIQRVAEGCAKAEAERKATRLAIEGKVRHARTREECKDASVELYAHCRMVMLIPLTRWDIDPDEVRAEAQEREV